ncbi:thioredoxin reductase (NADPH) [Clostridium acidisoli DSM 12555]|uniref:Thioredoxin reductase (NADPH) n=1 Tax=Clostridium acidisoli DSM 12555 TaxID=1121291 RepID=A0A1W1Y0H5_9CLOT|nr:NAD(P)/FAD-dependent oxidoreductase [Clostridium acidisoli]SMC29248.1 thioredoxin reductase (NADPH) [Clostridium acidisoli DSM 12555]
MEERYDIAIIGSGPAGLSAAINAKIRNKKYILFGTKNLSFKIKKAPKVNNYLGFYDITGEELGTKFKEHIENMGVNITEERVNAVYAMGDYFTLMVNDKAYESKTLIIASGMEFSKPLKGEEELIGKGVGYCATCDAPLYKGKTATIVAYTKEAESDANYVSELVSKLYYVPLYRETVEVNSNIQIINDRPLEILGDEKVEKLQLKNSEISTDAVFILKDSVAPAQLVPGLLVEDGHIKADRKMLTNIEGCYAAGDCTGKPYQYLKSAGEGQVAALNAIEYLDTRK